MFPLDDVFFSVVFSSPFFFQVTYFVRIAHSYVPLLILIFSNKFCCCFRACASTSVQAEDWMHTHEWNTVFFSIFIFIPNLRPPHITSFAIQCERYPVEYLGSSDTDPLKNRDFSLWTLAVECEPLHQWSSNSFSFFFPQCSFEITRVRKKYQIQRISLNMFYTLIYCVYKKKRKKKHFFFR